MKSLIYLHLCIKPAKLQDKVYTIKFIAPNNFEFQKLKMTKPRKGDNELKNRKLLLRKQYRRISHLPFGKLKLSSSRQDPKTSRYSNKTYLPVSIVRQPTNPSRS